MATDVSICTTALILIGDEPITSLSDNTRGAQVCNNIYTNTKQLLLSMHPWRFTVGQASLNKLVTTPLFDEFSSVFQLPADYNRIIRTENNSLYKIYEDKLYSNENSVNIEYSFNPLENQFPAYFTRSLELKMATLLAASVAEDPSKYNLFDLAFDKEFRSAKAIDNQSKQTDHIPNRQLIDVRFTG